MEKVMKRLRRLVSLPLFVAGMLLPVGGCSHRAVEQSSSARAQEAAIDRVTAGKPVKKSLKRTTTQPGRIEAFEEAPLYPKLAGYVQEVLVDIGDSVEKDQLLIKLSVPEMLDEVRQKEALVAQAEAETKQADAGVKSAEAAASMAESKVAEASAGVERTAGEYERWQAEHARLAELADKGSVTQKLVDETRNQLRSSEAARQEATAKVKSAEAALRAAVADIDKSRADVVAATARQQVATANLAQSKTMFAYADIKAPFKGTITRRNVNIGHYVHPSNGAQDNLLLVIAQTDKVRVFVDVPEMEAPLVDAGAKPDKAAIRVQALGEKAFDGTITRTSQALDEANRSLRVEIDLPNPTGELRPGMYAKVEVLLDERVDVLTLPVTAIAREGSATYCCAVVSGKIERKPVELGLRSGGEVEIRSGIEADQMIVLARADSLNEGQAVEIISAAK